MYSHNKYLKYRYFDIHYLYVRSKTMYCYCCFIAVTYSVVADQGLYQIDSFGHLWLWNYEDMPYLHIPPHTGAHA